MPDGEERSDGEKRALEFLEFLNQSDDERLRDDLQRASFDLFVKEGAEHGYHFTSGDLHRLLKPIKGLAAIVYGGGHR